MLPVQLSCLSRHFNALLSASRQQWQQKIQVNTVYSERVVKKTRKSTKFLAILVAMILLANLCGCATATASSDPTPTVSTTSEMAAENGTTGAPSAELAGESVRNVQANQDERGDLDFDEETDTDASAGASEEDGSPSVVPPAVDEGPEPEPEPETEVVVPEEGQYAYTVGDTTVYTEHPIERWLTPSENPKNSYLDLGQMLEEVWQIEGMDNNAGYSFYGNGESKWLSFDDEDDSHIDHTVTMSWLTDGTESSVTISMANYRYEDPCFYIVGSRIYAIDKVLAVLRLLTSERIEEDPDHFTLEDLDLGPNFDVSYN